ncbi:MAG: YfhO family protein [Acidobacteria bacterium]|nr:YfhO family protein [Acidobacteriota bacterium]
MRPTVFAGFLLALVTLDLSSHFSGGIQPASRAKGQNIAAASDHWKMPRVAQYLRELRAHEVFRVDDLSRIFPPNFGDAWLLEETMGHGATARADYLAFRGTGWGPGSNATALLNARYCLSSVLVPGMPKPLAEEPLYRNIRALPRAFAVARYRTFDSDKDLLNWLPTPLFAPGDSILVRGEDLRAVAPEFLRSVACENEEVHVQPLSYWTAAERKAQVTADEEERYKLVLFRPPWGWSVGDELTVSVRPREPGSDYYLVLDYWPAAADASRIEVHLEGAGRTATLAGRLPGLSEREAPFAGKHSAAIPLGTLAAEEYRLSFSRTGACSARLDSARVTRFPPGAAARSAGEVRLDSMQPTRLRFQADLDCPAFVVVSESWYPGWVAFVDGKRAPLLKADHVLMAVPVPAGRHEVVLLFRSGTFRWGLIVSLVSLAALAASLGFDARRRTGQG